MIERDDAECVADFQNQCGEAPLWQPDRRRLVWADIETGRIYAYEPTTGDATLIEHRLSVSGLARGDDGTLLVAGDGAMTWWRDGQTTAIPLGAGGHDLTGFNDLTVDHVGRVYIGTIHWDGNTMTRTGDLYRVDIDGRVHKIEHGIQLSNGLGFSPDGRTFYLTDSAARTIWAYDADPETGTIAARRPFVRIHPAWGIPDGLEVDAEGHVWSALWYGGQIVRFAPDGRAVERVRLPVQQVSSVAFGGDDLTDLYITTAGNAWPSALAPSTFNPAANVGGGLYRTCTTTPGQYQPPARVGTGSRGDVMGATR